MTDLPTRSSLVADGRAAAEGERPALSQWRTGGVASAILSAMAQQGLSLLRRVLGYRSESMFGLASGGALDTKITDEDPALTRGEAAAAVATLTVTRGAYVGAHTITAGTDVTGTDAAGQPVTWSIQTTTVLSASASSVEVVAVAPDAGPAGNLPASSLTTIDGLPDGLTVSQPSRASGGADVEDDVAYLERRRLARRSRGVRSTPEGLLGTALGVSGVSYAAIDETETDENGAILAVYVYVGDPDATADDALVDRVQYALDTGEDTEVSAYRAAGIRVIAQATSRDERSWSVTWRGPADITESQIKQALIGSLDTYAPAASVYLSSVERDIHQWLPRINAVDVFLAGSAARVIEPAAASQAVRAADDGSTITVTREGA